MPIETYNEQEELEAIRRRYTLIPKSIEYTLERLKSSDNFTNVAIKLYEDGWKDWHILLAIYNVVFNWRVLPQQRQSDVEQFEKAAQDIYQRWQEQGEQASDEPVPESSFTYESMQEMLDFSITSFLKQRGAEFRPRGYNFKLLRNIVRMKYHYFDLDTPHPSFFQTDSNLQPH